MGRTYEFIGSYFPEILEAQSNGKVIGLGADLTHRIAREMDVDINITLYPLKRAHLIMKRGQADAIIGPYKSKNREAYLDFSNFHFYEDEILFYGLKKSQINWKGDFSKLRGLKIGAIRGWSLGEDFNKNSQRLDIIFLNNIDQLFTMLKLKRIDIAIAHNREASRLLSLNENKAKIKSLSPRITLNKGYFGFSKKKELKGFKERFEAAYKKMTK